MRPLLWLTLIGSLSADHEAPDSQAVRLRKIPKDPNDDYVEVDLEQATRGLVDFEQLLRQRLAEAPRRFGEDNVQDPRHQKIFVRTFAFLITLMFFIGVSLPFLVYFKLVRIVYH
jgi:hypothetical protein